MSISLPNHTIVFADLRGSTGIFLTQGNARASVLVAQSVALAGSVVQAHRGQVIKTLGDGLMAIFESPIDALDGVMAMRAELDQRLTEQALKQASDPEGFMALRLQIAVAQGELVALGDDVFGDAVNVAARLLDHAGDHETLATGAFFRSLPESKQKGFRSLNRVRLRGRAEPVDLFLLDHPPDDTAENPHPATTACGDTLPSPDPTGLRLTLREQSWVITPEQLPWVLGRSPQSQIHLPDTRVSRSHARIDWNGASFLITDLSFNGTFIHFGPIKEWITLRRSQCSLHGHGHIGLGASPLDPDAAVVVFDVLRGR
jgi:adenylate cyclase